MDDASGRAAMGQIALRAPKAHDEECVVVATEKRVRYFESSSVGAPCFKKGTGPACCRQASVQRKTGPVYEGALAPGSSRPSAKAHPKTKRSSRSTEALLPPHKCRGSQRGPAPNRSLS